jgi:hypothetical protein
LKFKALWRRAAGDLAKTNRHFRDRFPLSIELHGSIVRGIMGFSKDGDGGESAGLTVVRSGPAANTPSAVDAADKATLAKLAELRQEHRVLDEEVQALIASGVVDQLQLTRFKKRKLMLRDQIAKLEDQIVPDIIA